MTDPHLIHSFGIFLTSKVSLPLITYCHYTLKLKFSISRLPTTSVFSLFLCFSQFLYSTQAIWFPSHYEANNCIKTCTEVKDSQYQFSTTGQYHLFLVTVRKKASSIWTCTNTCPCNPAKALSCFQRFFQRILYAISKEYFPACKVGCKLSFLSMRRYSLRNVGRAAVRIHTMKSSLIKPLLSGSESSIYTGLGQFTGFVVPRIKQR